MKAPIRRRAVWVRGGRLEVDIMICPECGKEMIWDSDATFEDMGYEHDGVARFYHCPNCGVNVTVYIPEGSEEECEH